MRGASRGVLEVEQPDRAGAENSAGFCLGRAGLPSGVRRLRLRLASEVPGSLGAWPCGITTALRGARWTGTGMRRVTPAEPTSQEAQTWGSSRWREPETQSRKQARRREPRGCGAPQGARLSPEGAGVARRRSIHAPRGAPRPLMLRVRGNQDDGVPGAAKNTGA
jgi:membrane peptidoglycan carboxypeptidase